MYIGFAPGGVDAEVRVSSVFEDLATADEDDVVACELPGVASEDLRRGSQFGGLVVRALRSRRREPRAR